MIKRIKRIFFITDTKIVNKISLKNKSLEELMTLKDEDHDFLSINIPIVISGFGIVVSAILSINPKIGEQYPNVPTCISRILMGTLIWMYIILHNLTKEREITKQNLKIYDKEIFRRLKEYKEADENFKKEVSSSLKEIKEKL